MPMQPRNLFAKLIVPLLFASDCGSLLPVLADSATQAFEAKVPSSAIGTIAFATDTPNLLGYWRFDPVFQTESCVNGYTGTLQGNAQIGPPNTGCPLASDPGKQGLLLDGTNSYLTTSLTGQIVSQGTILAWVYLTAQPSTAGHIFQITAQSEFANDFDLQIQTDDHVYFYTDSGSATVSPQALPLNQWHFLAATFIANSARSIYLDGQLVASSIAGPHYPNHNPFWIGNNQVFGPRLFQGRIDEVAIFNRALTAAEIAGIASAAQRPTLSIATLNNAVLLTWTTNFMGYKLQSSATLNPAQWTTLTNNYSVISNNFSVTHPLVSSQMFFRLLPVLVDSAAPADEEGHITFPNRAEPVSVQRFSTQGELRTTGNRLDLAIEGSGFFEIQMPDGARAYTRDGSFTKNAEGRLVTRLGYYVLGVQPVTQDVVGISFSESGLVTYSTASGYCMFQLQIARFPNPDGLEAVGANLFQMSTASGPPERGNPGEKGFGILKQGYLESSNVSFLQ